MKKRRSKKPSERRNSRRAGIGTFSKRSDHYQLKQTEHGVNVDVLVPEALLDLRVGRMVASQRAIARAYGVADSTVAKLVALGYIRRHGAALDLLDTVIALRNRPSPGRPPRLGASSLERSQPL